METKFVSEIRSEKKMPRRFVKYKLSMLMIALMKIKMKMTKIGHILQIIHTEY